MGADLSWPNEPVDVTLDFKRVGENFVPALGFTNRRGIDQYRSNMGFVQRYRNSFFRRLEIRSNDVLVFGLDGHLQSTETNAGIGANTINADAFSVYWHGTAENVDKTFLLANRVPVNPGKYAWNYLHTYISTSPARPLAATITLDCCKFYNGTNIAPALTLDWRPNETWSFDLSHQMQFIRLPTGDVDVYITSLDATTNFTPDMTLRSQVQYDNITKRLQLLLRYHWEYEPGNELFIALGEDGTLTRPLFKPHYLSTNSTFLVRLGHTFQF